MITGHQLTTDIVAAFRLSKYKLCSVRIELIRIITTIVTGSNVLTFITGNMLVSKCFSWAVSVGLHQRSGSPVVTLWAATSFDVNSHLFWLKQYFIS